jgi:hypothetical protein
MAGLRPDIGSLAISAEAGALLGRIHADRIRLPMISLSDDGIVAEISSQSRV